MNSNIKITVNRCCYNFFIVVTGFFVTLFNTSLNATAVFDPSTQSPRTIAPFVFKSTDLNPSGTKAYRPWFENGTWMGDLIEYDIAPDGTFSLPSANWHARAVFATQEANDPSYWDTVRKIITSTTGTNQIPFRWGNLTDAQKSSLDPSIALTDSQSDVLDFIRGNRIREGNGMRIRYSILGDMVGTIPRYVAVPNAGYPFADYSVFANTNASRAGRIYVGTNDGMVHVFNAVDGSEVFAYIPSMLIPNLVKLTQIPYTHTYFVDGGLVVGDAKIEIGGTDVWRTVLAGGMGAGGKGLFALDVTNPNLSSENASSGDDKKVLFEKTHSDLGHVYGSPSVLQLPDGKWYVVSGNGYGSTNGKAKLFLFDLNSPSFVTTVIPTDPTDLTSDNGLSTPVFLDIDHDSVADVAYAGDLKGRLWKLTFDVVSGSLTVIATKIFDAGVDQPITVAPDIAIHPTGGYLIYFGTGSLLSASDISNTDQQSVYAIWDKNTEVLNDCTGDLLCQTLSEATLPNGTTARYLATSNTPDWSIHNGWKVNLASQSLPPTGERLLGRPQLRGGRLQFVSTIPNSTDAESWLIELDYLSGGDSGSILFDLDGDLDIDANDLITVGSDTKRAVAKKLGVGTLSQPALARISNGSDTKIINGLLLTFNPSCTGSCSGGLVGGHFDIVIDTAKQGLGGTTDAFYHQYDDNFGLTYADYFDLQGITNYRVTDNGHIVVPGGIDEANQKLVALLANADLSPGAVLTIGDRSWNAVEYQKLIQKKLSAWDSGSEADFVDNDGNSLAFTLDEINSANGGTGTLRISFDDQAILTGGLIPDSPCVHLDPLGIPANVSALTVPNGRWRAGALTMQLMDYNAIKFDLDNSVVAANRVYRLQDVTDLPSSVSLPNGIITLEENSVFFGGIIANPYLANNAAFLYESTLFWHFSDIYCYGSTDWENQKNNTLLTISKINDFLTSASAIQTQLLYDIFNQVATISNYICSSFSPEGICLDGAYGNLASDLAIYLGQLENALLPIFQNYAVDISDLAEFIAYGGIAAIQQNPGIGVAATTDLSNQQSSPGPSFTEGRQSWLEIELGAI